MDASDLGAADLELGLDVQRTLDGRIRPLLNVDAGDIEIVSVRDGHVRLDLLGGCARCVLKLGCQAEMVLPVLQDRFAGRGARFSICGVPDHVAEIHDTPRRTP
jgi:Fe-S cluster biogenesis protein NfuA